MITSQDFRSNHKILFSAPILNQVKAEKDFSAGWGDPCSTGNVDVIDLNGNGSPDTRPEPKRYSRDMPKEVYMEEPALHAPSLQALKACAQHKGQEILTPADLPGGVFICNPKAEQLDDKTVVQSHQSIRHLDSLVAEHFDPQHPEARWAIDVARQEMLIYAPNS